MFEKYLEDIGLSDKEAQVYLALLKTDHASVLELSDDTQIKRSTVYVVLESLAQKGLVSETQVGKKTHFQAEPPERLETYIERQKVVLDEHASRLEQIIPQLRGMQRGTGVKPVVKYFEGREGIISSLEEFYASTEPIGVVHMVYSRDLVEDTFTESERVRYASMRENKDVPVRSIYTYEQGTLASGAKAERHKIDGKKYPISCDLAIAGDKVRVSLLGKSIGGIFIKNREFAETLQSLIDLTADLLKDKEEKG